ncbi:tripartite tricarboxylate transporter substrate binding protein [Pusillimonas sp. MFBS29]|uniref:Bug family tripartite tricarboxylate transporter substrate binding protein n=1 Tax=Pusillimonas sp. MFBS29 TaxID=2886690 RepID=UPI001D11866C|nr:tripartite tricarboxylate transporter substrate binding protein [Pusillimonas sp. MFBS29]MCC2597200.1 tripartite tricarboxylate transporter substrate binding protein [Pusillimonas sp. MFBS29]
MPHPILTAASLGIAMALSVAAPAQADTYPDHAVTLMVPFAAGGGGDTLGRIYADALSKTLNQTIVVENRPGAGGNIGTASVTRAKPDGYTLAYGTNGTGAINHWIYKDPGFTIDDLEPISRLTTIAAALVVQPGTNIQSVKDLIAYGKANPEQLTCGSAGNGTTSHIACELFKQMTGVKILHIPYKGGAAAMTDLLGGRIDMLIDVMPNLAGQIAAGTLLPLAVTTKERADSHPEIPTMDEAGVPGYYFFAWDAIYAPKGTPTATLDKLNEAVKAAVARPETTGILTSRGATPATTSREELKAFVQEEYKRLGEVVKKASVQID